MNCPVCGTRIEKEWGFCPRCGSRISGDFFDEIFSRMRKELAEMNRLLEKDIEAFDLSPWFRDMGKESVPKSHHKRSGFTIKIVQAGARQPDISVRTFGDVDRSKLKKEIEELGGWQDSLKPEEPSQPAKLGFFRKAGKPSDAVEGRRHQTPSGQKVEKPVIKGHMRTEEPKTSVASSASRVVVSIHLPGVDSEKDIEISELESSVEVKALAKDKAYFKILTKPPRFRLSKRSFRNGVLEMEFS